MHDLSVHWAGGNTGAMVTIAQRVVAVTVVLIVSFGGNVNAETALAVGDRVYVCYELDPLTRIISKTSRHWDGCEGVVELVDGANVGVRRTYPICVGYETSDGDLNIIPVDIVEVDKVACWNR